jgi:membrane associated rhomboid family serine protease
MTRCHACGAQSLDPSTFVMTARGPICDGCHRQSQLAGAEAVIQDSRETDDFRRRNFGLPVVSLVLAALGLVHVIIGWFDAALWTRLIELGSDRRDGVLHGEVYRLVTSLFLHAGFEHWLMNALALIYIGWLGERFLGRGCFLLAFLFSGVAGAAVSCFVGQHPLGSIGASGAVFGLFACVFVEAWQAKERRPVKLFRRLLSIFVVYFLLNEALVYMMEHLAGSQGIDHLGHLGGLLCGALFGLLVPMYKPVTTLELDQDAHKD